MQFDEVRYIHCFAASSCLQFSKSNITNNINNLTNINTFNYLPDKPAMNVKRGGEWVTWSYKQYHSDSRTVAKAFIKLGLERHHAVGILGFNAPEWFIALAAAISAGGISCGIYTTNSPQVCKYIADLSRANIVVIEDEKQLDKILAVRSELPHLKAIVQYMGTPRTEGVLSWRELLQIGSKETDNALEERLKRIAINQCCGLIFTSGTTGMPKVRVVLRNVKC